MYGMCTSPPNPHLVCAVGLQVAKMADERDEHFREKEAAIAERDAALQQVCHS
jgi:hypothetical protein